MKAVVNERTDPEKVLVAGMIFSGKFFHELAKAKAELLSEIIVTKTGKLVVRWCFDHCEKYNEAPKQSIHDIKDLRMKAAADDDERTDITLAEKLIDSVCKTFSESDNWDAWLDYVFAHIKKRKIENMHSKIELLLDADEIESAEELISDFHAIQKEAIAGVSMIDNATDILRIVNEPEEESVLGFPGAIGELIGPCVRGDLMAFVSPAKRGKSWWLQECAIRASRLKRTVVFYSLEMSEKQMISRIAQGMTRSLKKDAHTKNVNIPFFDENLIEKKTVDATAYTTDDLKRVLEHAKKAGHGDIHVCCFPAFGADTRQLKSHLVQLERDKGIVPDVIVVDYADILAPGIKQEYRHQIDHIWKTLRSLAQERNALVVTASHSNKSTFNKDMTQEDLSEDVRKLNHVSCMIGLNQTNADKDIGVMRAVSLAQRHDSFNAGREVVVLYNYDTGRPLIDSKWERDTNYRDIKKSKEATK